LALLALAVVTAPPTPVMTQSGGCFGGGGNVGGGAGANGVIVDADGVLRRQVFEDPNGALTLQRILAAKAKLDKKVAAASDLRMVSLNRLEAAIRARLDKNSGPTDDMLYLAGLTKLSYVFFYPETKDIVLAGPAEGWAVDLSGRVRGIGSGRPVLELQDLLVALRAYPPGNKNNPVILCSIDPTAEGLKNMQNFLRGIGSTATPDDTEMIVNGLRTSLGMQNIRVGGISAKTHFAQVLIEADYRMKLIGIGLEKPAVKMASYVDKANPAMISRQALQRWYFMPDYKCVRVTPDEFGMELVGDGVKLVGEDQVVGGDGNRKVSGMSNKASQTFVNGFTQKYSELSARTPVFAQLRNVIDMAIAAAFIQQHDYYAKAGWTAETLRSEKDVPVETYNTPLQVETVVASIWKGNRLMTPVGGGVTMQARMALESANLLADEEGKVEQLRGGTTLAGLAQGQWWWDVEQPKAEGKHKPAAKREPVKRKVN